MQTGTISFCDKQSLNIKSNDTKKLFNDKLMKYDVKILQKHFERFGNDTINKLKRNPYVASLKSNGNPYLLFLTKFHNTDICIMIDKKIQQGYFLPRMIIDRLCFDSTLFTDTLFEGEMIKSNSKDKWIFMINDILAIEGVKQDNVNFIKRYNKIHEIVSTKYHPLPGQKFSIQIKKYFKVNDIDDLLSFKDTLEYSSRGIIFKPMFLKFRDILYNFDDSLIDNKKKIKYSEDNKFIESIDNTFKNTNTTNTTSAINLAYIHEKKSNGDNINQVITNRVLEVEKTDKPDVFNLYDDDKKHIGIACIPTLKTSKLMHSAFKNATLVEKIKFECKYTDKFANKWIPIAIANS